MADSPGSGLSDWEEYGQTLSMEGIWEWKCVRQGEDARAAKVHGAHPSLREAKDGAPSRRGCGNSRSEQEMHRPIKYVEKAVTIGAKGAWAVFDRLNQIGQKPSFTPKWSDKPLLKSYEKSKPPLGWPRTTDSLCPRCVPEIRQQILDGKLPHEVLLNEKVGEIKAQIIERDGKILMVKDCPKHGHFEDVMAIDTDFFKHLEDVFPGRDIRAHRSEEQSEERRV